MFERGEVYYTKIYFKQSFSRNKISTAFRGHSMPIILLNATGRHRGERRVAFPAVVGKEREELRESFASLSTSSQREANNTREERERPPSNKRS